jgi:hypothetical protein
VSLVDRIEALARAKGWHADQHAHGPSDCWLIRPYRGPDAHSGPRLWVFAPSGNWDCTADPPTAALWILLAVSGLPDVDVGPCPNECRLMPDGEGAEGRFWYPHRRAIDPRFMTAVRCDACTDGRDLRSPAQLVLDASRPRAQHWPACC